MTAPSAVRERCAVHPARPAVDTCPVCARPRCGADAAEAPGGGCGACLGGPASTPPGPPPPGDQERLVRAALAAFAVSLLGGLVASEYVEAGLFSYVGPFVVGVICGGAATKAGVTDGRGTTGTRIRAIAAGYAVLGVALGFVAEGSQSVLSLSTLLPYVCAAAGAILWTVPPRRRLPAEDQGADTEV